MDLAQNNIKSRIHKLKVRRLFLKGFLNKHEKQLNEFVRKTLLKELNVIERELEIREYYRLSGDNDK